jgi:hypothetical protein
VRLCGNFTYAILKLIALVHTFGQQIAAGEEPLQPDSEAIENLVFQQDAYLVSLQLTHLQI